MSIDPPNHPLRALDALGYDVVFVVDVATMKILYVEHGSVTGSLAFFEKKLEQP